MIKNKQNQHLVLLGIWPVVTRETSMVGSKKFCFLVFFNNYLPAISRWQQLFIFLWKNTFAKRARHENKFLKRIRSFQANATRETDSEKVFCFCKKRTFWRFRLCIGDSFLDKNVISMISPCAERWFSFQKHLFLWNPLKATISWTSTTEVSRVTKQNAVQNYTKNNNSLDFNHRRFTGNHEQNAVQNYTKNHNSLDFNHRKNTLFFGSFWTTFRKLPLVSVTKKVI